MNIVAKKCLNWKTPMERLTGKTSDLSIFRFRWWEPIWFLDSNAPFFEHMRPGYYLSIAHATCNPVGILKTNSPRYSNGE
jgi:hypothetical protein